MTETYIIFLAVILGIDCFIVSFSQGLVFPAKRFQNALNLAATMGFFQGIMLLFGYLCIYSLKAFIPPCSHWISFAIFMGLGIKFIYDAMQESNTLPTRQCIGFKCLIMLGIATSIDAMAAGVSLAFSQSPLIFATLATALASFIMSLAGFKMSSLLKKLPTSSLEIIGGLLLIGLAVKAVF